jgi:cytochrome c oxidase cbb3-type subunit 3/ubiquinol-cytochrome c reductase cytochrome c subunit
MLRATPWMMLCLFGLVSACSDQTLPEPFRLEEEDPNSGTALYAQRCALCHGDKGQGYVADNANALDNATFLATASDAFLKHAIERGRPGTSMSAWGEVVGGPLDDAAVTELIKQIRSFSADVTYTNVDSISVSGSAARAQAYYSVKCKKCHGEQGLGGQFMSIANPEFLASASDGYLRHAIRNGRPGTLMLPFAGQLSDQIIDDLVVLIRSWQVDPAVVSAQTPHWPEDPVLHPDGEDPGFPEDRLISVDTVHDALEAGHKMIVADARTPTDYVTQHIQGAVSVPFYDAGKYVDKLPRDVDIVTYCGCPHAASSALADSLGRAGFTRLHVLDEGYFVWRDRGYPLVTGQDP